MGRPKKDKRQVDLSKFYKAKNERAEKNHEEKQAETIHVIDNLSGDEPAISLTDCVEEIQEVVKQAPAKAKPKKKRRWRPAWGQLHKWAYPILCDGELRIKCEWCAYCQHKNPFANQGACTIQLPALNEHSLSEEHKVVVFKWENKDKRVCIPLPDYVSVFEDKEKIRVVTLMWQMYFVVRYSGPMELYEHLCLHQMEQGLPNMPQHAEYETYLNRKSGMEFVQAIKDVLWNALCSEIQASPWYSLMVDDSTDRGKESHLIVYMHYLKQGGEGANHVTFVRLIRTNDGGAEAKYDAIRSLLFEMGLSLQKLVAIATDGFLVMTGCRGGLVAKLKANVSHLLSVHCLAHRENLAASQAVDQFPNLVKLDKLCKCIYSWLHASEKRMDDLRLIEGALNLPELAMLQIHSIRWLSRGQVMERMVKVMPALLMEFELEKPNIYEELTIYRTQFYINLLADVCMELNVLSCHFQSDMVDIANISGYADATVRNLEKKFLRDSRDCGTKHLQKFVEQTRSGEIRFCDVSGDIHVHMLKFIGIEGSIRSGSFDDCMSLGKELVKKIVENLKARMAEDMPYFDACKVFSPKHYPSEELEMEACSQLWLEKLLNQYGSLLANKDKCKGELDSFTTVMANNFKRKSFLDAWEVCRDDITMRDSFPNMMRLWEILSVVPLNTAVAERGFSYQNTIKSSQRTSMHISTLENFMFIGLNGPQNTSDVLWDNVYECWRHQKDRNININA